MLPAWEIFANCIRICTCVHTHGVNLGEHSQSKLRIDCRINFVKYLVTFVNFVQCLFKSYAIIYGGNTGQVCICKHTYKPSALRIFGSMRVVIREEGAVTQTKSSHSIQTVVSAFLLGPLDYICICSGE